MWTACLRHKSCAQGTQEYKAVTLVRTTSKVASNEDQLLCNTFFKGALVLFALEQLKMTNDVTSSIGFGDREEGGRDI